MTGDRGNQQKNRGLTPQTSGDLGLLSRNPCKLRELAEEPGGPWTIDLVFNPDRVLAEEVSIAISSDSWGLGHAPHWNNLLAYLLSHHLPDARIVDFY